MAGLTENLDNMVVRVSSPDNQIVAMWRNRGDISLTFRRGAYKAYTTGSLEHQLTQLGTLMWTGHRRGYAKALSDALGYPVDPNDNEEHWDARHRRFRAAVKEVVASAVSPRGFVEMKSKGLLHWKARIQDGATSQLSEEEFSDEVAAVVREIMDLHNWKVRELKGEYYGLPKPGTPPSFSLSGT